MQHSPFSAPLTAAQLGIWLGQQLNSASPMYNAAEFIELRGALNVNNFTQALREVISETVTLNLIFEQTSSGPQQQFNIANWQLCELDFSNCAEPIVRAQQWMRSDLGHPVDLTIGPLFNQALIKLGEDHHLWYQRIHHIACDGFGFALITQAVAERYTKYQTQTGAIQIKINPDIHLTAFQRILDEDATYTASTAAKKDKEFWLAQLANNPLFKKTLPPVAIADTSIRASTRISPIEFAQLQKLAAQLELTWSDLLIASVAHLMYQHTAATDITLGLPVMNRMGSASLRVPTMVMNIIPLRIRFQPNDTFSALAQHASAQLKACRPHQRYRYEQLKHDLALTNHQRLFGPIVNIMPFDRRLDFANLQTQVHNLSAGPVEDISFAFVLDKTGGLRVDMDANPNRYSHQQLQTMQQELLQLVTQIQHNPQLPLVPDIRKLSWLEGKPLMPQTNSILASIYQQIQQRPQSIALQHEQSELTYQALAERSAEMALAIGDMEIFPHSIIALILPRGDMAITAALACMLINCTFVFIDPDAPAARNQLIFKDAQPSLIIVERITAELNDSVLADTRYIPQVTPQYLLRHNRIAITNMRIHIDKLWQQAAQRALLPQPSPQQLSQKKESPAYLIYTSGSTGTPKGVAIGHRALAEFVASNQDSYGISPNDRVLQFAPLHFDACIEEIFVSLSVGARLVVRNAAMLESMPAFIAQCDDWKISVLDLPTAFWHELAYACTRSVFSLPASLRTIIIGGEAVIAERVEQWRARYGDTIALFNTYGPSEATVIATCANLCSTHAILHNTAISIGEPLSGRALAVVDPHLNPLPKGEEGELLLLGAGLADGYLHLPEKTAEAFISIQLPWQEKVMRAYRTGDRVKINSANQVEFIGRLDDQLKISGYRIDPLEIEAALLKLPGIAEAVVVAVSTRDGNKSLVAHLTGNARYDIQQLRSLLNAYLPAPMLPAQLVSHQKLPRNSSGKIDRKQLQQLSQETASKNAASSDDDVLQDFTAGQQLIARIWQQVLGQESVALDDDFFALGGQSLQTIQVATRLATQLNRNIPVALLFQHPTIKMLSDVLFNQEKEPDLAQQKTLDEIQKPMLADCLEFEKNLPPAIHGKPVPAINSEPVILLTGATGFVGAQLLHQLLTHTTHAVICAVRAPSEGAAYQRLHKALAQQGLTSDGFDRVQVQLVDLEQLQLGLTAPEFANLANKATTIIHNAANTSVMRDYRSLRAANALSTGELLKLAAVNSIPFHLVSTIAVAPHDIPTAKKNAEHNVLEEKFIAIHAGLRDGYQQSKWVAEQMAAIAQQKGYAINVYRLARVTGAANSGYVNPKDLVWSILQAGLPLGIFPKLDIREPWTPVDKIARFIVKHSLACPGEGVFNLTPEQPIHFAQIHQWLADAGASLETKTLPAWCDEVKQKGRAQDQAIVEFFLQQSTHAEHNPAQTVSLPVIKNSRFTQLAADYQVQIPAITQSLFNRYFSYADAMGLFAMDSTRHEPAQRQIQNDIHNL